jgi:hypothetical protein
MRVTPMCTGPNASFLVEVNLLPRDYDDRVIHTVYFDATVIYSENVPTWTASWSHVVSVQNASPGMHSMRFVQLELHNSSWIGTACAWVHNIEITTDAEPNPWMETVNADTIRVYFNPAGVCGIAPCDSIHLIQVVHPTGSDSSGVSRNLSYAEQGFPDSTARDSLRTPAGYRVDVPAESWWDVPYYSRGLSRRGHPGNSRPDTTAFLADRPTRRDRNYPPGIVAINLDLEVCAVCSKGIGIGAILGTTTWRWSRPRGGPPAFTAYPGTRDAPSPEFNDALDLWLSRHPGFVLPAATPPTTGGSPCQ